jgi:hypothetical protein
MSSREANSLFMTFSLPSFFIHHLPPILYNILEKKKSLQLEKSQVVFNVNFLKKRVILPITQIPHLLNQVA